MRIKKKKKPSREANALPWPLGMGLCPPMHTFRRAEHLRESEWLTPPDTVPVQSLRLPLSSSSFDSTDNISFAHLFPSSFLVSKTSPDSHPFDVLFPVYRYKITVKSITNNNFPHTIFKNSIYSSIQFNSI